MLRLHFDLFTPPRQVPPAGLEKPRFLETKFLCFLVFGFVRF